MADSQCGMQTWCGQADRTDKERKLLVKWLFVCLAKHFEHTGILL